MPLSTGSSFTGLMVIVAISTSALHVLEPPEFALTSSVPPAVPAVWSQARYVRVACPLNSGLGTKRNRVCASDLSNRAAAMEGVPNDSQLVPPLSEYCHWPEL